MWFWEGNPVTTHECWGISLRYPLAPQNKRRTFFIFCFVSTNSTKILLLWKSLKKHCRIKNILFLGIALIDRVAISGRRINSDRKKVFFSWKSSKIVLENNSLREENILLTLCTNTSTKAWEFFDHLLVIWNLIKCDHGVRHLPNIRKC